jgi:hypothetical protein
LTKKAAHNSTFAIGGVSCSADSFVVAESFVHRINISGKKPAHRKSAKRYPDRNSQRSIFVPEHTFLIPGIAHTHALHLAKNHQHKAFLFGETSRPAELVWSRQSR